MQRRHFQRITDYHWYVQDLIRATKIRRLVDQAKNVELEPFGRDAGEISIDSLIFEDGASLRFVEHVSVEIGLPTRSRYAHHYERGENDYFRYDKDPHPDRIKPLVHELCHLHVNVDTPRYISHETNFEQVFRFILASFYNVALP